MLKIGRNEDHNYTFCKNHIMMLLFFLKINVLFYCLVMEVSAIINILLQEEPKYLTNHQQR